MDAATSAVPHVREILCMNICTNIFNYFCSKSVTGFFHTGRKNNWPPLPQMFPVGPCFYHDIAVDVPIEFQKTVKIMYNLWICEWIIMEFIFCAYIGKLLLRALKQ